jgi:hypothetical protein
MDRERGLSDQRAGKGADESATGSSGSSNRSKFGGKARLKEMQYRHRLTFGSGVPRALRR